MTITHTKFLPVFIAAFLVAIAYIILNNFFYLYGVIDGPFHLSAIREIGRHFPPRSPILHLPASADFHYNISVLIQGLFFMATGNMHLTVLVTGALFSVMLIYSFSLFAGKYLRSQKDFIFFLLATLLCWGPYHVIWAGTFSASGLMINGFYSQTAAYAFFLLTLNFAGKKNQNWQTRLSTILLMTFTIIQHMLAGCILIFLIFFVEIDRTAAAGKWRWKPFILCLISVLASLLLSKLWPFYDTWTLFIEALMMSMPHAIVLIFLFPAYYFLIKRIPSSFNLNQRYERVFSLFEYVLVGLVFIAILQSIKPVYLDHVLPAVEFRTLSPLDISILIGVFFIISLQNGLTQKNLILFWWAISLFAAAYLLWWAGKGLYWRVLLFSFFPLCILAGLAVTTLRKRLCKIILAIGIAFLIISNFQFMKSLCDKNKYKDLMAIVQITQKDAVILSDPKSSYLFSGLGDRDVVVSFASHWGHTISNAEKTKRNKDVQLFFESGTSAEQQLEILNKYQVTHIVHAEDNYTIDGSHYHYDSSAVHALEQNYIAMGKFGRYRIFQYDKENQE